MSTRLSRTQRLLNFLETGKEITPVQIENRFDLSARHAIYNLRSEGYTIYTNRRANGVVKYRMAA